MGLTNYSGPKLKAQPENGFRSEKSITTVLAAELFLTGSGTVFLIYLFSLSLIIISRKTLKYDLFLSVLKSRWSSGYRYRLYKSSTASEGEGDEDAKPYPTFRLNLGFLLSLYNLLSL